MFIDNVANLAVEQCLIDGVSEIISPAKVTEMLFETMEKLASESNTMRNQREQEILCKKNLQEALRICRMNSNHGSVGECCACLQEKRKFSKTELQQQFGLARLLPRVDL